MAKQRYLILPIKCGERTCASEPGKYCQYLITTHLGTRFHCQLFMLPPEELKEKGGWLQRHAACLALERKLKEQETVKYK